MGECTQFTLVFCVDGTASMGTSLRTMCQNIGNVSAMGRIVGADEINNIAVMVYRDYDGYDTSKVVEYKVASVDDECAQDELRAFCERQARSPNGGGDYPEACKTAAWDILDEVLPCVAADGPVYVIWIADAPAHMTTDERSSECRNEMEALKARQRSANWADVCAALAQRDVRCFPMITTTTGFSSCLGWMEASYAYMADVTGGRCFRMNPDTWSNVRSMGRCCLSLVCQMCGFPQTLPPEAASILRITDAQLLADASSDGDVSKLAVLQAPADGTSIRDASCSENEDGDCKTSPAAKSLSREMAHNPRVLQRIVCALGCLIESDDREHIMAFTYNELIGFVWRLLNKRPFSDLPEVQRLRNAMSAAAGKLQGVDADTLRHFIEASYDRKGEIAEMLEAAEANSREYGAERLYLVLAPTADDAPRPQLSLVQTMELIRSGNTREVVRALIRDMVVTSVLPKATTWRGGGSETPRYVPLQGVSDEDVFRLLPNLMSPGVMFEMRGAALLATICMVYRVGPQELRDKAFSFLVRKADHSWSDPEAYPENQAVPVMGLLAGLGRETTSGDKPLLPAHRVRAYENALGVARLRANRYNRVELRTPQKAGFGPGPGVAMCDFTKTALCTSCARDRSLFAMHKLADPTSGVCTLCAPGSEGRDVARTVDAFPKQGLAHFARCHNGACGCLYSLQRPNDMRSNRTKCPSCRLLLDGTPVRRSCRQCRGAYQFAVFETDEHSKTQLDAALPEGCGLDSFLCPTCSAGRNPFDEHSVAVKDLICREDDGRCGMPVSVVPRDIMMQPSSNEPLGSVPRSIAELLLQSPGRNAYALFQEARKSACDGALPSPSLPPKFGNITLPCPESGGAKVFLPVVNTPDEVRAKVEHALSKPEREYPTCDVCARPCDPARDPLGSMCGSTSCRSQTCAECQKRWFQMPRPGAACALATLSCPMCKGPPAPSKCDKVGNSPLKALLRNHGCYFGEGSVRPSARRAMSALPLREFDTLKTHVWCEQCNTLVELDDGGCCSSSASDASGIRHFACSRCRGNAENVAFRGTKRCPSCGVFVEKTGGCAHMECAVRECGHHWCWLCREDFGRDWAAASHHANVAGCPLAGAYP